MSASLDSVPSLADLGNLGGGSGKGGTSSDQLLQALSYMIGRLTSTDPSGTAIPGAPGAPGSTADKSLPFAQLPKIDANTPISFGAAPNSGNYTSGPGYGAGNAGYNEQRIMDTFKQQQLDKFMGSLGDDLKTYINKYANPAPNTQKSLLQQLTGSPASGTNPSGPPPSTQPLQTAVAGTPAAPGLGPNTVASRPTMETVAPPQAMAAPASAAPWSYGAPPTAASSGAPLQTQWSYGAPPGETGLRANQGVPASGGGISPRTAYAISSAVQGIGSGLSTMFAPVSVAIPQAPAPVPLSNFQYPVMT